MKKETLKKVADHYESVFWEISQQLFETPELSEQEYVSAAYLKKILKEHGFVIEEGFENLPTAFVATYCNKGISDDDSPVIAFIAEYDALPGYGPDKKAAHACGHNWIAASTCGAAIVLSMLALEGSPKIQVIGTPAEETVGAKYDMIRLGIFDHVDLALQLHPENQTMVETRTLAMDAIEFAFKGKSSHAAQYPHEGINALDGVQLTYAGINALRQHLKPDVRIHGIVTRGGDAPNVVPSDAACRFYVRSTDRHELNKVTEKVINCAKGAALMTGAELIVTSFENPFDNLVHVPALKSLMVQNMQWAGIEDISLEPEALPGSSDIGNLSHVVPTVYATVKVSDTVSVHEEDFLGEIVSDYSREQLKKAVLSMAGTAFEVIEDKTLRKVIRAEFAQKVSQNP